MSSLTDFYDTEQQTEDFIPPTPPTELQTLIQQIASEHNRRHIGWPCDIAQDFPIGEQRSLHIEHCDDCKRLLEEFERRINYSIE